MAYGLWSGVGREAGFSAPQFIKPNCSGRNDRFLGLESENKQQQLQQQLQPQIPTG